MLRLSLTTKIKCRLDKLLKPINLTSRSDKVELMQWEYNQCMRWACPHHDSEAFIVEDKSTRLIPHAKSGNGMKTVTPHSHYPRATGLQTFLLRKFGCYCQGWTTRMHELARGGHMMNANGNIGGLSFVWQNHILCKCRITWSYLFHLPFVQKG